MWVKVNQWASQITLRQNYCSGSSSNCRWWRWRRRCLAWQRSTTQLSKTRQRVIRRQIIRQRLCGDHRIHTRCSGKRRGIGHKQVLDLPALTLRIEDWVGRRTTDARRTGAQKWLCLKNVNSWITNWKIITLSRNETKQSKSQIHARPLIGGRASSNDLSTMVHCQLGWQQILQQV